MGGGTGYSLLSLAVLPVLSKELDTVLESAPGVASLYTAPEHL